MQTHIQNICKQKHTHIQHIVHIQIHKQMRDNNNRYTNTDTHIQHIIHTCTPADTKTYTKQRQQADT